ncbi:MAG: ATP-binding protein [Sedimentisphaerales bacterium]|nr:ATP-binding protein [Sedimentisphaerales bacterium]
MGTEFCGRPTCRWEALPNEKKIKIAIDAGVGKQFIRNGKVPTIEKFPLDIEVGYNQSTLLVGPVNTRKSWLMCCLAVDALRNGVQAKIINWSRFKRRVRSSYQPAGDETEMHIFDHYNRIGVLCIDDVGVGIDDQGRETKAAVDMMYDLIDQRYFNNQPIHMTANIDPGQLADAYGPRVARRIREMCTVIPMTEVAK